MMLDKVFILLKEEEIKFIPKEYTNVYTFSPIILKKLENFNLNILFPDASKTALSSEKRLKKIQYLNEEIIRRINSTEIFEDINDFEELLSPFLRIRLSAFLYLNECLPNSNSYYLIVNGKWELFCSKIYLIIQMEKRISELKPFYKVLFDINNFYKDYCENNLKSFINKIIINIQTLLLKNLLFYSKKIFLLSGRREYFIPKLYKALRLKKEFTISINQNKKLKSRIKNLFLLFINLISYKKYSYASIFIAPINCKKYDFIYKEIFNKFPHQLDIDSNYQRRLIDDIVKYLIFSDGLQNYITKIFKRHAKNIITVLHTTRFPTLYAIASIMAKYKSKVFLLTHGTHTVHKNNSIEHIANFELALGLLYSNIDNIKFCSPSLFSDDYLSSKNFKFHRIEPLNIINRKKLTKKKSKIKILHASTIKPLSFRTYYYESSFEYINGLKLIASKLDEFSKELEIVVRPRLLPNELTKEFLEKELEPYSHILKFSRNKEFLDDLHDSDCLISLSSTTLEQAFNMKIPCLSYGYTKYNHFNFYTELTIKEEINNFRILQNIENRLERKFIYSSNPVEDRVDFLKLLLES